MRLVAAASAALLVALTASCASGWVVRGRVVRHTSGPGVPSAEGGSRSLPLTSARVTFDCPEDASAPQLRRELLRTDLDGRFRGSGEGAIPMSCALRIDAEGYRGRAFSLPLVCTREGEGGTCRAATVETALPPSR